MRGTQRFPGGEPELNLLGFWNNYLLLFSPERGFPPLLDATKNDMPALVDLSSGYNKFKNTLGSGFSSGSDIPETELKRWVQQQTKLPKRKISANVMQQYSQMAALSDTSKDLARAMIEESGLSGRLSVEQRKNLKRRLNIALYCDLLG